MSFFGKAPVISCLLLCLIISSSVDAAEISLDPRVGFHGVFHLGYPFPLTVGVANSGPPTEGTVEVKVWKGGPAKAAPAYPVYYRREVFLSAQSRKSIRFTVDPDSVSRPLTVSFVAQREKLSEEIDLRRHFSPYPLILLVTENSQIPIPFASASPNPFVSLSLADLPSEFRAYRGVSTVILYEQSLRGLSKSQSMALERWLVAGGKMLILGSIYYAMYQEPSMSRFLPVRVLGLKKVSSLPNFERTYGQKAASLRNLLVQDSRLVEGRVLAAEKEIPLLVEMNRGQGKVVYTSLDVGRPPVSRWEGLPLFLKELLRPPLEEARRVSPTTWDDSVFLQLLSNRSFISSYVPLRPFFLWLLFYLGGLGFLGMLWYRERLPRRTLLAALLALILISSIGGYFHFGRGGTLPDAVLFASTLMESQSGGYVESQSNVALFSTQGRRFNLQVESGWSELEPVRSRFGTGDDEALVVEEEGNATSVRFPLREWSYKLFKIRSVAHFPIQSEVRREGDKLFLKLTNLTGKDLKECWLVISGQHLFLGDLLPGSTQSRELSIAPGRPSTSYSNKTALREISFNDRIREVLIRNSFFPQEQDVGYWGSGVALFFGWVTDSSRRAWVENGRVSSHNYTLFRAIIPLGLDEEDDE